MVTTPSSKSAASAPPKAVDSVETEDSAITRFFIAPLTFISFILSLAIIDSRNALHRTHIHGPSHSDPALNVTGRFRAKLHDWCYRPQPYAYVKSIGGGGAKDEKLGNTKEESWHWNSKQRKMMRMEVSEAFEMRPRIVGVLILAVSSFGAALVWGLWWCWVTFIRATFMR